ncbi:SPOSA6832_02881, partial [Sporobolomyces salmonicolor]
MQSSTEFTRQLHQRLVNRFPALFADIDTYNQSIASTYGATDSQGPSNGLQTLGADPTKIEPKVWLASERTLLSWFRVSLLLSSFALALFNSAGESDSGSRAMGATYAVIAVGMLGYAWTMHRVRRWRIVMRYPGHHGRACVPAWARGGRSREVLMESAVRVQTSRTVPSSFLVNFVLRVKHREDLRDHPSPKNPWLTSYSLVKQALGSQIPLSASP